MTRRLGFALLAGIALACASGCGAAPHTRAAGAVSLLSVRSIAWNPSNAPVGRVRAVADAGDVVAVFSDRGATVFSGGAKVASDGAITDWVAGGAVAGADGTAQWVVGVSADGRVHHLKGLSTFEDVSNRYGLGGQRVRAAIPLGGHDVGFLLGGGIAVTDGSHVARYAGAAGAPRELSGGAGQAVEVGTDEARVFDVSHRLLTRYPLPGVTHAAIASDGRLYATTKRAVYTGGPNGTLTLVYDARGDTLHGLVASGARAWFLDGDELGLVKSDGVQETWGAKLGRDASLSASATGDVWVLSAGALTRYAADGQLPAAGATWPTAIAPIFARACSACHLPDGISGTDLSNATAWETERPRIRERVVDKRTMPPEGHALSEGDREAIRQWVEGGAAR